MEDKRKEKKQKQEKNQITTDIGNTQYTINLHYKKGEGENYKDKVIRLLKKEVEN